MRDAKIAAARYRRFLPGGQTGAYLPVHRIIPCPTSSRTCIVTRTVIVWRVDCRAMSCHYKTRAIALPEETCSRASTLRREPCRRVPRRRCNHPPPSTSPPSLSSRAQVTRRRHRSSGTCPRSIALATCISEVTRLLSHTSCSSSALTSPCQLHLSSNSPTTWLSKTSTVSVNVWSTFFLSFPSLYTFYHTNSFSYQQLPLWATPPTTWFVTCCARSRTRPNWSVHPFLPAQVHDDFLFHLISLASWLPLTILFFSAPHRIGLAPDHWRNRRALGSAHQARHSSIRGGNEDCSSQGSRGMV